MRILLTGASGQVGGAMQAQFAGHDVIAPNHADFDLEQVDVIAPFIERMRPQIIVNCAAYTAVDDAERNEARAAQINGVAPGIIAAAARTAGAGLIHFSTDYVFDGLARRPYRESDPCHPVNVYGRTKIQGEQAIGAVGGPHLIVRTSWVYSAGSRNFLRTMLRLGMEQTKIGVVADQTGAPTAAKVLAQIVANIVTRMGADPNEYLRRHGGIVHAACSGHTTWHGFATAIFEELRRRGHRLAVETIEPIMSAQYAAVARRPAMSLLDLSRMTQEFGIKATPWRAALAQVLDELPPPH
jgi:dTDP-4-dehydrorhamnose reductase